MKINQVSYPADINLSQSVQAKRELHHETGNFQSLMSKYSSPASMPIQSADNSDMSLQRQVNIYKVEQLLSNPGAKTVDFQTGALGGTAGLDMGWGGSLLNSLVDFFKDLGSALTFGAWRPDGEPAPENPADVLWFAASKLKEAIGGDLMGGTIGSLIQMGEDLILAGWNLAEAGPDTLLGGFEPGRTVVDVHAWDISAGHWPVLYNLETPEHFSDDNRWHVIRNTPFRKSIETIGSLLADAALIYCVSHGITSSDSSRHE